MKTLHTTLIALLVLLVLATPVAGQDYYDNSDGSAGECCAYYAEPLPMEDPCPPSDEPVQGYDHGQYVP